MALKPWDERYNPLTGHWTCPMCLRRRRSAASQSDELGHLCDECTGILRNRWPTVVESGLRWKRNRVGGWMLVRVTGRSEVLGHLFHHTMNGKRFWAAELYMRSCLNTTATGSLSACAHALVDAVKDKR